MFYLVVKILSPLFYLVSAIYFFRYFSLRRDDDLHKAKVIYLFAILIHFLFLLSLALRGGHLPLAGNFQALTTFMFFFAVLGKFIMPEKKDYSLGFFNAGLLFLLQFVSAIYISPQSDLPDVLKDISFEIHVILNLIGYAAFTSAFLLSFMYLLLFYEIKSKKLGYFYDRLPSLAYLEQLNKRAIVIGFIFSTMGILTGAFMGMYAWGQFWAWDPKLISAVISWLIYGATILGHDRFGWSGKQIAYIGCLCFIWIIFSMLVITRYFSGIHSFV